MPKAPKKEIKLAPLKVKAEQRPTKTGEVVTIRVEGDYCSRYNEAAAICKQADELMKAMKPDMRPHALTEIFDHNFNSPWQPIISVALQDDDNNVTRISFINKYSEVPVIQAEVLFTKLRTRAKDGQPGGPVDINDYLARTIVAKFNGQCFLDAEGKIDKTKYDKIMGAMETVCAELKIPNPITTEEVVKPLPTFHARRWHDFDQEANKKITEIVQNQINFVPCPNAVTGLMMGEEPTKEEKK